MLTRYWNSIDGSIHRVHDVRMLSFCENHSCKNNGSAYRHITSAHFDWNFAFNMDHAILAGCFISNIIPYTSIDRFETKNHPTIKSHFRFETSTTITTSTENIYRFNYIRLNDKRNEQKILKLNQISARKWTFSDDNNKCIHKNHLLNFTHNTYGLYKWMIGLMPIDNLEWK